MSNFSYDSFSREKTFHHLKSSYNSKIPNPFVTCLVKRKWCMKLNENRSIILLGFRCNSSRKTSTLWYRWERGTRSFANRFFFTSSWWIWKSKKRRKFVFSRIVVLLRQKICADQPVIIGWQQFYRAMNCIMTRIIIHLNRPKLFIQSKEIKNEFNGRKRCTICVWMWVDIRVAFLSLIERENDWLTFRFDCLSMNAQFMDFSVEKLKR